MSKFQSGESENNESEKTEEKEPAQDSPEDVPQEDKPMTAREFKENINIVLNNFREVIKQDTEEIASKKVNADKAEFNRVLLAHEEAIKALAQRLQAAPPATPQDRAAKLDGFIDMITKISEIPLVQKHLGLESDPEDITSAALGQLVQKGLKRQVSNLYLGSIKSFTKKGLLFPEEVEEVIAAATEKQIHGV